MSKKTKNILIIPIISAALFIGTVAIAADVTIANPIQATSFTVLIDRVLGYALVVATAVLVGMIFIAAFQLLFAAGNAEQVSTAKKTIMYSVIAYVIVLIAKGLSSIIAQVLGVSR